MNRKRLIRFLRLSVFTITIVVIGLVGALPIGVAHLYIKAMVDRPCGNRPEPLTQRLSDPDGLEAFTFSPADGITFDAWFAPGTNGASVIILPGAWGGSNTMYEEMEFLHQAGYSVMTYDTRSCADPPQRTSLGYTEIADLKAAVDIMSARPEVDPQRIGVFGHSMGGATAIMTAAQDERIKAVAVTGNYADLAEDVRREGNNNLLERWTRGWIEWFYEYRTGVNIEDVRPIAVIGDISPRAVLLIHGSLEALDSRAEDQYAAAGEPKDLWIVEGARHGNYTVVAPEEYAARIIAFFDTYLNP